MSSYVYSFSNIDMKFNIGLNNTKVICKIKYDSNSSNDASNVLPINIKAAPLFKLASGADTTYLHAPYLLETGLGSGVTFLWQDGSTASSYSVKKDGFYKVTATTTSSSCKVTDSVYVYLAKVDAQLVAARPPSPACRSQLKEFEVDLSNKGNVKFEKNSTITFSVKVGSGSLVNEIYTLPNDILPGSNLTYRFKNVSDKFIDGTNSVKVYFTVTDDINRKNDTLKFSLVVGADPVINLANGLDTVHFTPPYTLDAGGVFKSYLWSNSAIERSIIVTQTGWYLLTVTNNVGCKAKDSVYLTTGTLVDNLSSEDKMSIFPNPASTTLNIDIENTYLEKPVIEVLTVDNKLVYRLKLNENLTKINEKIDVSIWKRGFYYIRVHDNKKSLLYIKKFVLQ